MIHADNLAICTEWIGCNLLLITLGRLVRQLILSTQCRHEFRDIGKPLQINHLYKRTT
jgi:hypothetical protein